MRARTETFILAGVLALTLTACDNPAPPAPTPADTAMPAPADTAPASQGPWEPIVREDSWYDPTANPENTYTNLDYLATEDPEEPIPDEDWLIPESDDDFNLMDGARDLDDDPSADFTFEPIPDEEACPSANFEQAMFPDACGEH